MPDLDLAERLPEAFPSYDRETDFAEWLQAHQDEVDALDTDLDDVQRSLQVAHASGDALDEIGKDFGIIGRRRGRDDSSYRQFLQSLVPAYSGRGTPPGLRLAIAAGVLADADDVGLVEDFVANRYEVELYDWQAHRTGTVHTLADVADPSVIQRRDPLHYFSDAVAATIATDPTIATGINNPSTAANVVASASATDTSSIAHLLDGALPTVSATSTTNQTTKVGLSGHRLGNGNTLGDGL